LRLHQPPEIIFARVKDKIKTRKTRNTRKSPPAPKDEATPEEVLVGFGGCLFTASLTLAAVTLKSSGMSCAPESRT
jgi:hypothetical protein